MLLEPAWRGVDDPIEKIWKLMDGYRDALIQTECTYGCPIGSLALDPRARSRRCASGSRPTSELDHGDRGLPEGRRRTVSPGTDRRALAEFVLTTMEGAVMLARSYRDIGYFDRAILQLKDHFNRLLQPARKPAHRGSRPTRRGNADA